MPIIDASPQVCQYLFNVGSCGWSDSFLITAVPTSSYSEEDLPLGPIDLPEEILAKIFGGKLTIE
jgi:hypothetical protein